MSGGFDTPLTPAVAVDPPARVARISYINGEASMRVAGVDDWTAATLNRPLTTGDAVWTGEGSRMELHTGNAAIRMASNTSLTLLDVGTNAIQIKLAEGVLSVHIRDLDENEVFEIDTPDAAISMVRSGEYRVESGAAGSTNVITRSGMAEVTLPAGAPFVLHPNRQASIPGIAPQPYTETAARPLDSFDQFCLDRDQREDRALAAKRVSPRMIGSPDLDDYGDWLDDPGYGVIWAPRGVPVGWAPYGFGRWVWIEPWGWTWLDDAPWGFAPFHYGRWVYLNVRWVWIPGPFHRYPVYAPALVVFLGGGGPGMRYHLQMGGGFGVAWFPLGPREPWFPPYHASRRYLVNVNITNTNIRDADNLHNLRVDRQPYVNRGVRGAVTAVPEQVFRRAEPVRRSGGAMALGEREIANAKIGGTAPAITPERQSLSGGARRNPPPRVESGRERQPVIVNRRPPASPVPFEQRKPAIDAGAGRPPAPARIDQIRKQQPQRQPEYRQAPAATRPTQPPQAAAPQPKVQQQPQQRQRQPEVRQERKWEQRTTREEANRSVVIERERRQQQQRQTTPPRSSGGEKPRQKK